MTGFGTTVECGYPDDGKGRCIFLYSKRLACKSVPRPKIPEPPRAVRATIVVGENADVDVALGSHNASQREQAARFLRAGKAVYRTMDAVPPPGARA